jgi:hypothetical protein
MRTRLLFLAAACAFAAGAHAAEVSVCSLLTGEDIRIVQGETVRESKESIQRGGAVILSQCYFILPTSSKSISLELARPAPKAAAQHPVGELWRQRIAATERRNGEEEEERKGGSGQRVKIHGVGQEAVWVRMGPTAALYALDGERWLKVSIGGTESEKRKIAKAKRFLLLALQRLRSTSA